MIDFLLSNLDMGKYTSYVWSSYGIAFSGLILGFLYVLFKNRRIHKKLFNEFETRK